MSSIRAMHFSKIGSIAGIVLNEKTPFPVKNLKGIGVDISNNDKSADLKFRIAIRGTQGQTDDYRVAAGKTFNELLPPFTRLDILQASKSFDIVIRNPR